MKKVKLFEEYIQEATTSWGKMMKGVRSGEGGPWSIVAIENNKVVGQSIDIKIQDLIPAKYEALKKEFPRAKFHIEDAGGGVVWNESFVNEAKDATREELMDLMETKYGIKSVRPSEDFDGQTEGIWIAADNEEELSGNKIFDYYNKGAKYKNGVLKTVVDAVEKKGWWFSWNDPGTIMCWPKN
jgi:hypothetical protein